MRFSLVLSVFSLVAACASVPPQVIELHQREAEVIASLQNSHAALVDAYVDRRRDRFNDFFFSEYAPAYRQNWIRAFRELEEREFDPERDFGQLASDILAEYRDLIRPLEDVRLDLHLAIRREYDNAMQAHEHISNWLASERRLREGQRRAMDRFLATVRPGLSLDGVEAALDSAMERARRALSEP